MATASGAVLMTAFGAAAEVAPAAGEVGEVVVTASRVAREGFAAPTPMTVIGTQQLEARAFTNVADAINEAPAFRASSGPNANQRGGGVSGGSFLDLRGLNGTGSTATARTLVLVDGRRHVPANAGGLVDLNMIPSGLVDRTEVVTGGASAAWGSDAVAGVVNIILKDRLRGIEGSIAHGQTDKGDLKENSLSLAGGTTFLGGRGRIVAGVDVVDNQGIRDPFISRDWGREGFYVLTFPAGARPAGLPSRIYTSDVRTSDRQSPGGVIFGGPLDNIEFTGGQGTTLFTPGPIVAGALMKGGGANNSNLIARFIDGSNLVNPIERYSALARSTFDFNDKITAFAEVSRAQSAYKGTSSSRRDDANLVIQRDNAFLPESVRAQMVANNLTTITIGRVSYDDNFGMYRTRTNQETNRYVGGLRGKFNENWKWNGYYQLGENHYKQKNEATIVSNYLAAVDAVNVGGTIVCRPGAALSAADANCVPFNVFGRNAPSQGAVNYVRGVGVNDVNVKQQVAAANLTGDLFNLPAGPVALAAGVEWRREEVRSAVDRNSQLSRFDLNNYKPIVGAYSTKEIYGELVVPLLKDVTLFKSLDFNGAVRRTDYSLSGPVTTWKVGGSWEPISSVRLRATQSRDIRAPNLTELYSAEIQLRSLVNGQQVNAITVGNPNLAPEKADTFTAGVVYQPAWLEGLRLSADMYDIEIQGAITSLAAQTLFDRCRAGATDLCQAITFAPNGSISQIIVRTLNFNAIETSGWDFEAAYSFPQDFLAPGRLQVRALGNFVSDLATTDAAGRVDRAKQTVPEWSWNLNFFYTLKRFTGNLQARYVGPMVRDATLIGPNDPNYSPTLANSTNDNDLPSTWYFNLSAQYDLIQAGDRRLQIYGVVNNIMDRDPPAGGGGFGSGNFSYDTIGRAFRAGVRFKY